MNGLIGHTLGQYRIVEQIGKGGMATVYKAFQPSLNRYVAIKVLPPLHAELPGFSERFKREAESVANLNHPNILPVFDYGQDKGYSYIAMRCVEGARTLKEVMGDHLSLRQAADLIGQLAAALDCAHCQGIVHRDVKPANVLMDGEWALLTDFGLARMTEASVKLTGSGVGVGTPAYMSPEQGQGLEVDLRSDIYSLGIILFEMLTGQIPHDAETPFAIILKRVTEPLPMPRALNLDIPEAVERIVLKALAREPQGRFSSAGEMARALQQAVEDAALAETQGPALDQMMDRQPDVAQRLAEAPEIALGDPPLAAKDEMPAVQPEGAPTVTAATTDEPKPTRRAFPWKWYAALAAMTVVALLAWGLGGRLAQVGWLTRDSLTLSKVPTDRPTASRAATATQASPPTPTKSETVRTNAAQTPAATGASTPEPTPAATDNSEGPRQGTRTTSVPGPAGGRSVRIGLLFPITGPLPELGQSSVEGAELALEEWNAKGGLLGQEIEWVLADGGCDGAMATSAAKKLIDEDEIRFIVGELCSSASLPVAQIADPRQVIQISPASTVPLITLGRPYVFRAIPLDPFLGNVLAEFARNDLGAARAAVLYGEDDPYAQNLAGYFKTAFEARAGTVAVHEAYADSGAALGDILSKVASADPDVLILPDASDKVNLIAELTAERGIAATLLGGDSWDSEDLDLALLEGSYFANHHSFADPRPIVRRFHSGYERMYGKVPDTMAVLTYDATNILLTAIEKAATTDTQEVREAMAQIEIEGVTGTMTFDQEGNPLKAAAISQVTASGIEFVKFSAP
jgi:branched-chain amino acid transport system substrate-binding protein